MTLNFPISILANFTLFFRLIAHFHLEERKLELDLEGVEVLQEEELGQA